MQHKPDGRTKQKRRGVIWGLVIGFALLATLFGLMRAFPPVTNVTHGETVAYHVHVFVDYYVNGEKTDMPSGIGVHIWPDKYLESEGVAGYAPLHTHDFKSTIHIEPNVQKIYHFDDFMKIWGNDKPYTLSHCLGELCTPIDNPDDAMMLDNSHFRLEQ